MQNKPQSDYCLLKNNDALHNRQADRKVEPDAKPKYINICYFSSHNYKEKKGNYFIKALAARLTGQVDVWDRGYSS